MQNEGFLFSLLLSKIVKQEIMRRNNRELAELQKVFSIVSDDDITTCIDGTLILHQVLKVTDNANSHSPFKLFRSNRDYIHNIC